MPSFKMIKGGLQDNGPTYKFIDAQITDTRLMGVLGLRVQWEIIDEAKESDMFIHQFYYYDIEELGLDSIRIYELFDEEGLNLATKTCFGGLGANMRSLSEEEARYLVCMFVEETKNKKQRLPENLDECKFVFENPVELSPEKIEKLNSKICVPIKNDYGVVNYYLMRGFGKDFEGQKLLRVKNIEEDAFDDISLKHHATFLQNSIERHYDDKLGEVYLSESLVESDDRYYIVTSELKLAAGRVLWARKKSEFEISVIEASTILSRKEYCTAYRICVPMEDFDIDFAGYSIGTTKTEHETGDMFMEFKPNNDHAESSQFKLYEDLHAIYYVTDYGELIVGAYTLDDIEEVENRIKNSVLSRDIIGDVKMQFENSVLYEFALSGYTSFASFIKSME